MAELLEIEARMKDFMSANLDTIVKKLDEVAKGSATTGNAITGMIKQAESAMGKFSFTMGYSGKAVEELGEKTREVGTKAEGGFAKMAASVFTADAAFKVMSKTVEFFSDQIKEGIEKYTEFQHASVKMEAVWRATDNTIGMSIGSLKEMAKALSANDLMTEADALSAESLLLTYSKIGKEVFPRVIELANDLSDVMGLDLQQATRTLAMALDNPQEGLMRLSRAGVKFTITQKEMIDSMIAAGKSTEVQTYVMDILEKKVGGVSAAIAASDVGQLEMMNKQMGEISKTIAKDLIPILVDLARTGRDSMAWLSDMITGFKVVAGIRLDDPIKDLTLINEEIAKWEKILEGKQNANWFMKGITNMPVEIQMAKDKITALKTEKEALQKEVDALIQPGKFEAKTEKIEDIKKKTPEEIAAAAEKLKSKQEQADREWEALRKIDSEALMSKLKAQEDFRVAGVKSLELGNKERLAMMDNTAKMEIDAMTDEFAQKRALLAIDIEERKNAIYAYETFVANAPGEGSIEGKKQVASARIALQKWESTQIKKIGEEEAQETKERNKKRIKEEQETRQKKFEIGIGFVNDAANLAQRHMRDSKQAFNAAKALMIVQATVNGIMAASNGFREGSNISIAVGIAEAVAAGVVAAGQVASIASQKYAVGTSRFPGGRTIVGEQGPELAEFPIGTKIHSALSTRNIVNNASNVNNTHNNGGNTLNVTISDPVTGQTLTDMLRDGKLDTFVIDFKRRGNLK